MKRSTVKERQKPLLCLTFCSYLVWQILFSCKTSQGVLKSVVCGNCDNELLKRGFGAESKVDVLPYVVFQQFSKVIRKTTHCS